jgi:diguanylate cyclase (GGDEF)-like protein
MVSGRRMRLGVAFGASLILGTLIGGSALLLERTRQTALHAADTTLQNATLVVENTINRQLLQVDGALASLPALFAAVASQNGETDQQSATRLLRSFNFETFAFRDLLLLHADGTLWASARPRPRNQPPPRIPPPGRIPHPGAVAVEGPVRNPLTGNWTWLLARPITLPGVGELQAVAEVPVVFITALLAPVGEIPGLRINIERPDGLLLASLPHDELQIGKQLVPALNDLGPENLPVLVPPELMRSATVAMSRHTLYPDVQVTLTLDLSTAMADWVRDRNRLLIVVAAAGLLVLALAVALYAAMRQRERVETERMKSRETLDSAIESMSDGFVMWDEQDRLITCNQRYRDMYSVSAPFIRPGALFEDIIREGAQLGQYPQAGDDIIQFVRDTVEWHRDNEGSLERLLPGGRWVLITERHTPSGGTVGIRTDITALKEALSDLAVANERARQAIAEAQLQNAALTERDFALRTQNMLFDAALNNMSQGLLMVDSDQRLIVCNNRFLDIFRITVEHPSPGTTTAALFHSIETAGGLSPPAVRKIYRHQEDLAASQRSGMFVTIDDDRIALAVSQCPLSDGGWVATYEDVTEQQRTEGRIRFMAHHDTLTQLPNRVLFHNSMNDVLSHLTEDGRRLALLYLDLDKFKYVNDTLGHPAGDALLEIVARRLRGCVRESDIVARLGGDEFAILYLSSELPIAATTLAQRLIDTLSVPYQLGQRQVEVGVSVGIAIATGSDIDGDTLLKNADMALYQAKAKGRKTYCVFEADMEARLHARLTSEADLRVALERGQFEIYYQPILDLNTDRLSGFEALLRWNHPTRGVVFPGQFIPLAEELGIIKSIGAWLFRQACSDAVQFLGDAKIAVNLSPIQLEDDGIIGIVNAALSASGLDPARLEIEITESALLKNSSVTIALLVRLHGLGLSIALDDFGTGYSSLSYLRSFPFDKIKIDRLFISEMATRDDCAAIVSSIVSLAARLGMTTTAEGVETQEQLDLVRNVGCSSAQGYLFGRPEPIRNVFKAMSLLTDGA